MTKDNDPQAVLAAFARNNPFIALMPGMEPLHKTTEIMMKDMAEKADAEDAPIAGQEAMAAGIEAMSKVWPGFKGMPNLAAHPMGAMAAGSALTMGMASQMMGTMLGAMTGMMEGVATRAAAPAPAAKPKTAAPGPAASKTAKATTGSASTVTRIAPLKERARPKTAATGRSAGAGKTAAPKKNGAAKSASAKKPTAEPVTRASPASTAILPEDYKKPAKMNKPAQPDDLKKINGVGPKLEQVLNTLGIWTYRQIAALKPQEIAWLDDYLQFPGRIGRDDWIGQAEALQKTAA